MNYTRLEYGSKGDDVKNLQSTLNTKGYSLDVDGSYGPKTQAAVKDYQSKNNLAVDGVVGNQTWTSLLGSNNAPQNTVPSANKATTSNYNQSALVQAAQNRLNNIEASKPGGYQSKNNEQLQQLLNQVLHPEAFSYNPNNDSTYLQYRDQYTAQGKKAMEDSIGKAVSLSGGFNNSYAQQVGQSTYNNYMSELTNKIPELEQIAYQRYRNELADKQAAYETLKNVEDTEYSRYMDILNQYNAERDYAANRRDTLSAEDYNRYLNDIQNEQWERQYNYQLDRDKIADERYDAETMYKKYRDSVEDSKWNQEYRVARDERNYQKKRDEAADEAAAAAAQNEYYDKLYSRYLDTLKLSADNPKNQTLKEDAENLRSLLRDSGMGTGGVSNYSALSEAATSLYSERNGARKLKNQIDDWYDDGMDMATIEKLVKEVTGKTVNDFFGQFIRSE